MSFPKHASYKVGAAKNIELLPEHWSELPLKRLFKLERREPREDDQIVTAFRDGTVTLRKNRREEGFTNALKETGYQRIHRNDLVIHAMDAFAGAIGVSDSDGKSSPVYSACTPIGDASPKFYGYYLRNLALRGFIESLAKGIRERSTDFRWIDASMVSVPVLPKEEQLAIVTFLDRETAKIDALIAEQRRLIELLQEKRQAVISHAVTKGLNPDAPMKDSGVEWLGEVPEHWRVVPLKNLVESGTSISYGIVQPGEPLEDGIPFVQTTNMTRGEFSLEALQKTSVNIASAYPRSELKGGEVLLGIRASIGAAHIAPMWLNGANLSRGVARIAPSPEIKSDFLVFYLRSEATMKYWLLAKQGSTFNEVSIETVKNLRVCVPESEEQREIADYIRHSEARYEAALTQSGSLISLLQERRSALISAAVTGQIDVRGLVPEASAA